MKGNSGGQEVRLRGVNGRVLLLSCLYFFSSYIQVAENKDSSKYSSKR